MILELSDIGDAIQLAIAPVFLLAGVSALLIVLTNRLGRLIDRSRVLEDRLKADPRNECMVELLSLYHRTRLINVGITASTVCGLLVCVVIAMLFLGDTTDLPLDQYIAPVLCGRHAGADRRLRLSDARDPDLLQLHARAAAQGAGGLRGDGGIGGGRLAEDAGRCEWCAQSGVSYGYGIQYRPARERRELRTG